MVHTLRAVVRNGTIEFLEPITLPDGIQLVVTVTTEDDHFFWKDASSSSLQQIWDNCEDDIYAELLAP